MYRHYNGNKNSIANGLMLITLMCLIGIPISFGDLGTKNVQLVETILMSQYPNPVSAGDTVEIELGVMNLGELIVQNATFEFVDSYPFELAEGENRIINVGPLLPYRGSQGADDLGVTVLRFNVKVSGDAIAGAYPAKIALYTGSNSTVVTQEVQIQIKNKETAEIIHIDKGSIVPGNPEELTFTINNVGKATLRDLTFSWENQDDVILPVGSDNTKYISSIPVGQSANITYTVIADTSVDPGLYKLDLKLSYYDSSNNSVSEILTIAGLYVGGETDFDVSFSETSSGQTSFSIANIGSNPGYSVTVSVPDQNGWSVTGSNTAIIGNLNKGDYTITSFTLTQRAQPVVSGGRNVSQPIQAPLTSTKSLIVLQIAYTDTAGQRLIVQKEVTVPTTQNSSMTGNFNGPNRAKTSSSVWLIIVGVVLVLFLAISAIVYRKKKLNDPSFSLSSLFKRKKR